MTKDEALKMALETLECWQRNEDCNEPMSKILESIKEALVQPEQEPVAWEQFYPDIGKPKFVAQPEREPVAWLQIGLAPLHEGDVIARTTKPTKWNPEWWRFEPLYTTPPQLKPLTGWQPIETAPRDGTEILMTNGVDVSSGQWFSEYGGTYDQEGAPNGDERDAGWMDWIGGMQPDPTHWMPLPSPPIEAAHGIKDKNTRGQANG